MEFVGNLLNLFYRQTYLNKDLIKREMLVPIRGNTHHLSDGILAFLKCVFFLICVRGSLIVRRINGTLSKVQFLQIDESFPGQRILLF